METISKINKLIVFLLEIIMLIALSYWGFHHQPAVLSWILGIGTPLLAAFIWSIYAAPLSAKRLRMPYRAVFAIAVFATTTILLYQIGLHHYAIALLSIALITQCLAYRFES